ncbi:MAG: hypothetical protein ACAI35_04270 [Candidatus Methylacidiphilales bacterium]|nr:hypothetical protein [Candidatus Methylacidiphilales bacterium]
MSQPTTTAPAAAFDPHNIPVAENTPIVPLPGEPPVSVVVAALVIKGVLGLGVVLFVLFLMYVYNWNLLEWWT